MKKIFVLLLFAITFSNAQDAKSLIKDIQDRFSKIKDLSADALQNSSKSRFFYQKENKYRIETKANTIVSDGSTIWNHTKKNNKVVISRPEDTELAYTINNLVYAFPEQSKVSFEGKEKIGSDEFNVLLLTPLRSSGSFSKIKIWSDSSNLIRKVSVTDKSGTNLSFEFSNIRINNNIPDSKFSFEPPEGSEIIDLR